MTVEFNRPPSHTNLGRDATVVACSRQSGSGRVAFNKKYVDKDIVHKSMNGCFIGGIIGERQSHSMGNAGLCIRLWSRLRKRITLVCGSVIEQ